MYLVKKTLLMVLISQVFVLALVGGIDVYRQWQGIPCPEAVQSK